MTEEQSQRGETLAACVAEIDHCRPYLIGLLGERYGWVPCEDLQPNLLRIASHIARRIASRSVAMARWLGMTISA